MNDMDSNKANSVPNKPKKRGHKTNKGSVLPVPISIPVPMPVTPMATPKAEREQVMSTAITKALDITVNKYADAAAKHNKEQREDFDCLQPIISEFLDDFLLIGHTIDGQRVTMKYTSTPADVDKLTELCKKVFVKMMASDN